MIRLLSLLIGLAFSALALGPTVAPALAEQRAVVFSPGGVALAGYDPVAYFTEGRAVPGSAENSIMWRGATWYFATPESMMKFEMNPQAYAPQFGGYCAYGVAEGQTTSATPDAFFIYNGKLYFMHDVSMLKSMAARLPEIVATAESHWPDVLGK